MQENITFLKKIWKLEKFSQNFDIFSIPNAITQKVLKLQISDGVHWKAKNVSFPNNIIWDF